MKEKKVREKNIKKTKRPFTKDDFDFVLTGVTKPLKKEQGKKESGKT